MNPTPRQQALLDRAVAVLDADERILAAWLGGSFGQGAADEWSDVDVHCCVVDGALPSIEADLDGIRDRMMTSLVDLRQGAAAFGVVGFTAVDADWGHVDVMFYDRAHTKPDGFIPLFDRAAVLPIDSSWRRPTEPWWPDRVVQTYLYALGQWRVVLGRDDRPLMQQGAIMLREQCLVALMHAENGYAPAGGLMRYSQWLTAEQCDELLTMPPITADRDELIACHRWLAETFIRRARALAERLGAEYPDALERAARRSAGL